MKQHELHRTGKYSIGVADDLNFYAARITYVDDPDSKRHGEESLAGTNYFPKISGALDYVARHVANREAKTLDEYIAVYTRVAKELVSACQGA